MSAASIGVLVSVGRHPESGRRRRAPLDARAVELALRVASPDCVELIHAGDPSEPVLRDYLGMGASRLTVLDIPSGYDPFDALASHLRSQNFGLVLTGTRAEGGTGSGFLPYSLAHRLGSTVIASASGIGFAQDGTVEIEQVLEGRLVRRLRATLPALVAVGPAAPPPRQSAFARARRGRLRILPVAPSNLRATIETTIRSDAGKPRQLRPALAGFLPNGARKKADAAGRLLLDHPTPDDAATAILNLLAARGLWGKL